MRASVSFSISETGVSRSATRRVQTTWFRPAAKPAVKSSIGGKSCIAAQGKRARVDSSRGWFTVTRAWSRSAAV